MRIWGHTWSKKRNIEPTPPEVLLERWFRISSLAIYFSIAIVVLGVLVAAAIVTGAL